MQDKVLTALCFNDNALEAVEFYMSLFEDSKLISKTHYGKDAPFPAGVVMTVHFQLGGRDYLAFNGGPQFRFSPGISLMAQCDTQEELDRMWERLADGGSVMACGWVTDKFGVAWQVVPSQLDEWMSGDPEVCERVCNALWQMIKLDIAELETAAKGG